MKKKLVVLLSLVLVMCSLLCACGKDDTPSVVVTVITNSGTTEEFTSIDEFAKACNENEAYFEKEYLGAKVTVVGQVSSVDNDITSRPTGKQYEFIDKQDVYVINLIDYVQVVVLQEPHSEVVSFKSGTEIEITSIIQANGFNTFNAFGGSSNCLLYAIAEDTQKVVVDTTSITLK